MAGDALAAEGAARADELRAMDPLGAARLADESATAAQQAYGRALARTRSGEAAAALGGRAPPTPRGRGDGARAPAAGCDATRR